MNQGTFLLVGTIILAIAILCGCESNLFKEKIIKGNDITKMTIYTNEDQEGPYVIKDKKIIDQTIRQINMSPRRDISKITFERGADGRIIFEGKNSMFEVGVFSDSGDVVTQKYYIPNAINLNELIRTKGMD
jgi:alpha-tubulin suppressor-like RCC1 family protein